MTSELSAQLRKAKADVQLLQDEMRATIESGRKQYQNLERRNYELEQVIKTYRASRPEQKSDADCERRLAACIEKEHKLEIAYEHMQKMNAALVQAQTLLQATIDTLLVSKDVAEYNVDLMLYDTGRQPLRRSFTPPPQRRYQQQRIQPLDLKPSGQRQLANFPSAPQRQQPSSIPRRQTRR